MKGESTTGSGLATVVSDDKLEQHWGVSLLWTSDSSAYLEVNITRPAVRRGQVAFNPKGINLRPRNKHLKVQFGPLWRYTTRTATCGDYCMHTTGTTQI